MFLLLLLLLLLPSSRSFSAVHSVNPVSHLSSPVSSFPFFYVYFCFSFFQLIENINTKCLSCLRTVPSFPPNPHTHTHTHIHTHTVSVFSSLLSSISFCRPQLTKRPTTTQEKKMKKKTRTEMKNNFKKFVKCRCVDNWYRLLLSSLFLLNEKRYLPFIIKPVYLPSNQPTNQRYCENI